MRYCIAVSLCLLAASAQAETYDFLPDVYHFIEFKLGGDYTASPLIGDKWQHGGSTSSNITTELDFDWAAETMTYGYCRLAEPNGLRVQNQRIDYTADGEPGTGNEPGSYEVVVNVTFDPFVIESFDTTTVDLIPTGPGTYDVSGPPHIASTPPTLTGAYSVVGPTETIVGPFSITFDPPMIEYSTASRTAGDYPGVKLDDARDGKYAYEITVTLGGGGTMFDATVEGHSVSPGIESITYGVDRPYVYLVPEPAALVLLLIGLLCAAVHLNLSDRRGHC